MTDKNSNFIPVRTSTFISGRPPKVDLYVLVENRPIRYAVESHILDEDRLNRLKKMKVRKVLIREEAEEIYRQYLSQLIHESQNDAHMELEKKTAVLEGAAANAADDVFENPKDANVYIQSTEHFGRFGEFLSKFDQSMSAILKLSGTVKDDYTFHGGQVAAMTLMLCERVGLIKDAAHRKEIVTGCFLHDLGAEHSALPRKEQSEFSEEERKLWLQHCSQGVDLLSDRNEVTPQVRAIVAQHEETFNGDGFPEKLPRARLDPVAAMASLANRFDHYANQFGHPGPQTFKVFITDQVGRYDLPSIQLLEKILKDYRK